MSLSLSNGGAEQRVDDYESDVATMDPESVGLLVCFGGLVTVFGQYYLLKAAVRNGVVEAQATMDARRAATFSQETPSGRHGAHAPVDN